MLITRNSIFPAIILIFIFSLPTVSGALVIENEEKVGVLPGTPLMINPEGTKALYHNFDWNNPSTGIYNFERKEQLILPTAEWENGIWNWMGGWDTGNSTFVFVSQDSSCIDPYNHSNRYECDAVTYNFDISDKNPLIHELSIYCSTYDDEDHGWLGGVNRCDKEPVETWNYYGMGSRYSRTSEDGTHTAGFDNILTNSRCTGCENEYDTVLGFTTNELWTISHNNSTFTSGISYAESHLRFAQDHADVVAAEWIPGRDLFIVVFEDRIAGFAKDGEKGWVETSSISSGCYDGHVYLGDRRSITYSNQNSDSRMFSFSPDASLILVLDDCGDWNWINISDITLSDSSSFPSLFSEPFFWNFVLIAAAAITIHFLSKSLIEPKSNKRLFAALISIIVLLPGCLEVSETSNLFIPDLTQPNNVEVLPQNFSDETVATVLFEKSVPLEAMNYYYWDGSNHVWGQGPQEVADNYTISGYCPDECLQSLTIFWTGYMIPTEIVVW